MREVNEILYAYVFTRQPKNCLGYIEALIEDAFKNLAAKEAKCKALPALKAAAAALNWYVEGFLPDPGQVKIPSVPSQYKKPHAIAAMLSAAFAPDMEVQLRRFFTGRLAGTEVLQERKMRVFVDSFKKGVITPPAARRAGATKVDVTTRRDDDKAEGQIVSGKTGDRRGPSPN